jgi:hypothetical protein
MNMKDALKGSTTLIDVHGKLIVNGDDMAIYREQDIPDWYLDQLKDERLESANAPAGDFHRIASIPVAIVEHMQRAGIDPYNAPVADIVKWIKNHAYDKFLTSSKAL